MSSFLVEQFYKQVQQWAEDIESYANVEEAIEILTMTDAFRKRIDRIQADPQKRPVPRVMHQDGRSWQG